MLGSNGLILTCSPRMPVLRKSGSHLHAPRHRRSAKQIRHAYSRHLSSNLSATICEFQRVRCVDSCSELSTTLRYALTVRIPSNFPNKSTPNAEQPLTSPAGFRQRSCTMMKSRQLRGSAHARCYVHVCVTLTQSKQVNCANWKLGLLRAQKYAHRKESKGLAAVHPRGRQVPAHRAEIGFTSVMTV